MLQTPDVTGLLAAWTGGNREALDSLMPVVMEELKKIARAYLLRERHAETLQTTALVNEAYLRLVKVQPDAWENRAQFFALAAQMMRRILVDHARAQLGPRRGGGAVHVEWNDAAALCDASPESLIGLDDALMSLERLDPRKARIVELRVFAGMTPEESAHVMNLSIRTVSRDWQYAKAWLARELHYTLPDHPETPAP